MVVGQLIDILSHFRYHHIIARIKTERILLKNPRAVAIKILTFFKKSQTLKRYYMRSQGETGMNKCDQGEERPLSPHLTIYKLQITTALSIMHRASGVWLYFGILFFSWVIILTIYSELRIEQFMGCSITKIGIFSWTISLFYHLLNGIRHLFWDAGYGFNLKTATKSGIFVLVGTILLTVICYGVAYN